MEVTEQGLPGEAEVGEEEAERRGLPDLWIHDHGAWSLIIENKIASPVKADQIVRHRATASRRGFEDSKIVVISPEVPELRSLAGATNVIWPEVYAWLLRPCNSSEWTRRLIAYLEAAEARMVASGYLTRGSLTKFSGIHFTAESPWNYREAKRLLRLAMNELRKSPQLRQLGMDPTGQGRPAITGRDGSHVWDFLPLRHATGAKSFTQYPHLTLALRNRHVLVMVTVPNAISRPLRRSLLSLGGDGFCDLVQQVGANLSRVLRKAAGAKPWMDVTQRHYLSQRSAPIEDARLEFDLRTAGPVRAALGKDGHAVRPQPQWLRATYEAWAAKDSNLQLGVGAIFPYDCSVLQTREALDYFAATWLACEPLLKVLFQRKPSGR